MAAQWGKAYVGLARPRHYPAKERAEPRRRLRLPRPRGALQRSTNRLRPRRRARSIRVLVQKREERLQVRHPDVGVQVNI